MLGAHLGLEVGQGGVLSFGALRFPFGEEADGQPAEHAQYPYAVAIADSAVVFVGGNVEALVQAGFNAPISAVGLQPLRGVEFYGTPAGQEPYDFGFSFSDLAEELRGLLRMGKADWFGVTSRVWIWIWRRSRRPL